MNHKKNRDLARLHQAGFGMFAIFRLRQLRRRYAAEREELERLAQHRRLEFMRWLVTGKLTEQVSQVI
jgi:hypothetical protein